MFSLISGSRSSAKAIFPDQLDSRFDTYFEFKTFANGLADGASLYSEPSFSRLFLTCCRNSLWYRENYNTAVYCFFLLISDPGILFAQTREWRAAGNAVTQNAAQQEDEMTDESAEVNLTEIAGKGIENVCRSAVQCESLLPAQLRNALQVVIHEWNSAKKGRPAKILFYPEKLYEQLAYQDREESEEEWMHRRRSKLYEKSKVLGIAAEQFYQRHKDKLMISEDQWRDVVLDWLGMLASYISMNSYQPIREYRPFFLLDQIPQLTQMKEKAESYENCLKPKDDRCPIPFLMPKKEHSILQKPDLEGPFPYRPWDLKNEYPLKNCLSPASKLKAFEDALVRTGVTVKPDAAGILFIMRSHMHPLLSGRNICDYPKNSSRVFVTAGVDFFDAVQAGIKESIQFQERNLRCLDSIYIRAEELENARLRDPSVVNRLEEEISQKHKDLVDAFFAAHESLLLTPRHPAEKIRDALRVIVEQLDWMRILPEDYVASRPYSPAKESWRKERYRLTQYGLVEYIMLQELAEQGRNDLKKIAQCLFCL